MRSYQVYEHGEPSTMRLEDVPDLIPGPGQILVDVEAAGINFPDILTVAGTYQLLPQRPFAPGKDFAGVVRAIGPDVTEYLPGDRVMSQIEFGALAEQALATASQSFRVPDEMAYQAAAAMGLVYQTAWFALIERGQYKTGETVLVGGAAGGVGLAAVQLAVGLGATVIAAVRSDAERKVVLESGAHHVIDLSNGNLRDSVREQVYAVTDGRGADVILDPLGGEFFHGAIRATAWCGRVVVIGFVAGDIPSVKVNYLLLKNISVAGLQWSDYRDRAPEKVRAAQESIFGLWRAGCVRPVVMRAFAFEEAAEAMTLVRNGDVRGKVVVNVRSPA
ncbi:NADPH:quinone oxidoreductase family protein [Burkholderia sp. Ac-20353]|uniref:NADPH:quinone oxidoreductase family protein n=1 Tax=Burkholderia sp. Ac-20353 TaxID=2703894 RepID=UPI00197C095E|nr:NADPH:quinone oxidoreductase family protein [Burkholderia sp. Ac-20353]MBN3786449.1 NADPH:quinone oxidoreductase family protein [Burkholderia sp. Ac-20353]